MLTNNCVDNSVCVSERERQRDREREKGREGELEREKLNWFSDAQLPALTDSCPASTTAVG